jgi:hypothetical protein
VKNSYIDNLIYVPFVIYNNLYLSLFILFTTDPLFHTPSTETHLTVF